MQTATTICQMIYYIAMSIAGPLAVIAYIKVKKTERLAKEYQTYDELDNRFFEYQKLALEYYDLDILDVPNNDPSLAFDKKRKQEMVAYAILFSLFERAYLMFSNQADMFRQRQWSGWKHFLNDFLLRENVRIAWGLSKNTYDTDFQSFMDEKVATVLSKQAAKALVTPEPAELPIVLPVAARASSSDRPAETHEAAVGEAMRAPSCRQGIRIDSFSIIQATVSRAIHDRGLPCNFDLRKGSAMLGTILIILLILMLLGALPTWGHSRDWGYGPSGGVGLLVLVLVVLVIMGRI